MASTVLTPKTLNSGFAGGALSTAEASTNSLSFVEVTLGGVLDIDIPPNIYYCICPFAKAGSASYPMTIEFRESDGITVIETFTLGNTSSNVRQDISGVKYHDDAKWSNKIGVRIFIKVAHTSFTGRIYANGIYWIWAPHTNIADIECTKMQIDNLKLVTISTTPEGTEGAQVDRSMTDWVTIPVNAIKEKIVFSGNSGELLYDWDGYSVGIAP